MLINNPASAVQWARVFMSPVLFNGAVVVDATAGNGHDTLFMAERIGSQGHVFAFDIQEEAIKNTKELVLADNLSGRVSVILAGHQKISNFISQPIDGAMFNLGYLPGGDKEIVTEPKSTKDAILSALHLLKVGGRISVVVYTGHPGSQEEAALVDSLFTGLEIKIFNVQKMVFHNSIANSPVLYFATRMSSSNKRQI